MSVQRFDSYGYMPNPEGKNMRYADHARIVAERVAEVTDALIDARREALAELEQAHAAALAKQKAQCIEHQANAVAAEREKHAAALAAMPKYAEGVVNGWRQAAAGEVPGLVVPAATRTLTAADPGYHSQRCLHCDHIRATHILTAHGCIGHALPGRPGADCPCAEFIHDGEATPQGKPCSTCGEPVAYLTARPGWAGGWLHHPSRPLDGHPAAIDGEATT